LNYQPVIVIPAFRRAKSLCRLLTSLRQANFSIVPHVIISLEGGAESDVKEAAYSFANSNMNIDVKQRSVRLGLREHILKCGDYALEYGSVIVLEDDLYVDRYFYDFASSALKFYGNNERVAGIALYAPEINEFTGLPFCPTANGYSTYPLKTPCSWGQAWSAEQWLNFRNWYSEADATVVEKTILLPDAIKMWPESSWKKYFAAYLSNTSRDFIYPYQAFTTNCSDAGGEHIKLGTGRFQVRLAAQSRPRPEFIFDPFLENPNVSYDPFMEPNGEEVFRAIGLTRNEVEIDTQGKKPLILIQAKEFVLTSRPVREAKRRFPLTFRPVEANLIFVKDDEALESLSLAESKHVRQRSSSTLEELSYFVNFNFTSMRFGVSVLRAFPNALFKYTLRAMEWKKWRRR
jgi:hypothetical protein